MPMTAEDRKAVEDHLIDLLYVELATQQLACAGG